MPTYPPRHDVSADRNNIGPFKHLPPTLLLQYPFVPDASFSPDAGLGLNDIRASRVKLAVPGAELQSNSPGLAVQLDGDIEIDGNWPVNLDVKYAQIRTGPKAGGSAIDAVKFDPMNCSRGRVIA